MDHCLCFLQAGSAGDLSAGLNRAFSVAVNTPRGAGYRAHGIAGAHFAALPVPEETP